ncbi:MAG: 50S ribosome-binding GTPase [Candidatus ainarchaeum sp.]|nr:50S ribosome-binding GTPase [Candidatus ainarchaeum sp.]
MASNASLEFIAAQTKYDAATSDEERLIALQQMKSTAPSHKGAENLRAEINRKISALKSNIERQKTQVAKKGSTQSLSIKKDGIGQVVILGLPNTGKSTLLNKLAGKDVAQVLPYAFSTIEPVPAMMNYDGTQIQLVEVPAIIAGSSTGKANGKELISIARSSDGLIILGSKEEQEIIKKELEASLIFLNRQRPPIEVKPSVFQGVQVAGKEKLKFPVDQLIGYLKSVGKANSTVIISGQIESLSQVSEAINESVVYKSAIFVNSYDVTDHSLIDLKDQIFLMLNKILVYTKKPGKEADLNDPLDLDKGSTLADLAVHLHKDFAKNLKSAKIWGSAKFPGQRVGPDYELKHKDIVEIII